MSRPRLGKAPTVIEAFRLPEEVADRFREECERLGYSKSEVVRKLVERWLRQVQGIKSAKARTP